MKRYLLFVIAFVCVSIGMQIHATTTIGNTTWCQNNTYAAQENVLTIDVTEPGELATAIAGQNFSNVQILHIGVGSRSSLITLSNEDIAALSNVNVKTIEMMRAYVEPFTLTNSNVERIILPYNWTKEQVKAVGEANTSANFEACISMNDQDKNEGRKGDAALIAYLKKANTLKDAVMRTWNDANGYAPLGNGFGDCSRLKYLTVMGNICARDISRQGVYDANGHYQTRGIPDENNNVFNINTEGEAYYVGMGTGHNATLVSNATPGALDASTGDLYYLDLRDASLPDEYAADIVFKYSQMGFTNLKEIWMPQDPDFKTVPADYLNITSKYVHQICIPGNIENIKTRAFAGTNIDYIWTTGDKEFTVYDNGAAFVSGSETTWKFMNNTDEGNIAMTEADYNNFQYGTITLPAGLRLIERFAFRSSEHVKDVYVLNEVAPECHVDAFSTTMYLANDAYDRESFQDGIITRDAYINNKTNYTFMTMLHYPRETGTPNTQRYTDPSREYSVATGERDGNGNMIYFPNQTEYIFAHLQGSYGYTWKAWDDRRNYYDNEITLAFQSLYQAQADTHTPTRPDLQTRANELWEDNPSTMLDNGHLEKYDRTFYDLTMGGYNEFGEVSGPDGDIIPYYQVERRPGVYLYDKAVISTVTDENGDVVYVTKELFDEYGQPAYVEAPAGATYEGNFAREAAVFYDKAQDGAYCHPLISDNNGTYTIGYSYTPNSNGGWVQASYNPNLYIQYQTWMDNTPDYQGAQRYDQEIAGLIKFTDQHGAPRFNIGEDYVLYDSYTLPQNAPAGLKAKLQRFNSRNGYTYRPATSEDTAPFYVRATEEVPAERIDKYNDYRGWHQFVLTGVAHNSTKDFEPLRSFITDNDWWTICSPVDLRYEDLKKFYGTDSLGLGQNIPYLSKLMYVIRDVENQTITLMFSKNLMEYKEQFRADDTNEGGSLAERVHGYIEESEKGKYTSDEIAANPVILHAGVPYMIRPNLTVNAQGNIDAVRQFDIYKNVNPDLYERLKEAQEQGGTYQKNLIYKGMYTVPAYVVGESSTVTENTTPRRTLEMKDGSKFTYDSTDKTIKYHGKDVPYSISQDFTYTFVGTFYKSVMPQYCYFLGWDSEKNRAAFWYSRVQDKTGWNWNNETGVICPNFNTNLPIHAATGLDDPARWILAPKNTVNDQKNIKCDDFVVGTQASNAKQYTMDYGATMNLASVDEEPLAEDFGDQEVLSIDEIQSLDVKGEWYNVNGQKLNGRPTQSGVYIMGHKKYVVK